MEIKKLKELHFINENIDIQENICPTIISGWDHSPRSGKKALVLTDFTPDKFQKHVEDAFDLVNKKDNKLLFVKSWNEWAEGNYLEPDLEYGTSLLERFRKVREKYNL